MMRNETWSAWYDSLVATAYMGFVLYEVSEAFRKLLKRLWNAIKPYPKTKLNGRLARELEDVLREMNEWH